MKELIVLMAWHVESDVSKAKTFEENRKSFVRYNPDVELITIMSAFDGGEAAWLGTDISIFTWYNKNKKTAKAKRYLIIEWDCWCDCDLNEYFKRVWDCDVVAPCVKYPERDEWYWFSTIESLPPEARPYATGVVPFCGIMMSHSAMERISKEIVKEKYAGLMSELRFGTIATMLNFDPIVNPVCNRAISWTGISRFDLKYPGLHHPRKKLEG